MAANKVLLNQIELNSYKKIPPIEKKTTKSVKLKLTDPLVAPVEKLEVPNYVLNTSINKCPLYF